MWTQLENTALDLESFARHARRSVINVEDVLLLARRNEGLETILRAFVEEGKKKKKQKGLERKKGGGREGDTGAGEVDGGEEGEEEDGGRGEVEVVERPKKGVGKEKGKRRA